MEMSGANALVEALRREETQDPHEIEARLKRILAHSHDDQYVSIVHFIDHIRLTLQEAGKWPEVAPEIEELL